ncbi:MAG: hypothetical protein IPL08_17220 [Saprospiraceae bacterium]|nr:hypothetical protein [Saprospiraceae bacterium]
MAFITGVYSQNTYYTFYRPVIGLTHPSGHQHLLPVRSGNGDEININGDCNINTNGTPSAQAALITMVPEQRRILATMVSLNNEGTLNNSSFNTHLVTSPREGF